MVGKNHENFPYLITEGRDFLPNWSPSGQSVLYSITRAAEGFRPSLWVSGGAPDNMNDNRRNIALNTWADKCTWLSETKIICAVPITLEEGIAYQRALSIGTPDDIYSIDLATNQITNLGRPDFDPTISRLVPGADGNSVLYQDAQNGQLFRFTLKPL
jgi:hypothetical protein